MPVTVSTNSSRLRIAAMAWVITSVRRLGSPSAMRPAEEAQQQHGQELGGRDHAEHERVARELQHQPALGDGHHPGADEADRLAARRTAGSCDGAARASPRPPARGLPSRGARSSCGLPGRVHDRSSSASLAAAAAVWRARASSDHGRQARGLLLQQRQLAVRPLDGAAGQPQLLVGVIRGPVARTVPGPGGLVLQQLPDLREAEARVIAQSLDGRSRSTSSASYSR